MHAFSWKDATRRRRPHEPSSRPTRRLLRDSCNPAQMTTLVTGATGFIGRHLSERLTRDERRVKCLVRPMSDTALLLRSPNVDLTYGDIRDPATVRAAATGVRVVYHLAIDYSTPTLDDIQALIPACLEAGVERLVYFSSI